MNLPEPKEDDVFPADFSASADPGGCCRERRRLFLGAAPTVPKASGWRYSLGTPSYPKFP